LVDGTALAPQGSERRADPRHPSDKVGFGVIADGAAKVADASAAANRSTGQDR
jgi:hypothetical protein